MSNDDSKPKGSKLSEALKILSEIPVASYAPVPDSLWITPAHHEVPLRQTQLGPHWYVVSLEQATRGVLNGRLFNVAVLENAHWLHGDKGDYHFRRVIAELRFYLRAVPYDNLILA